ncbi:MAG TPA: polyprenyl synthetase family protein [Bacteroidales bacterium]|nr:polyprenyl synthetase family protein [Bacteroidales bacterium]HRZ21893.1 polyprenyl synthetase family protein [Bacteroidales bacterium]
MSGDLKEIQAPIQSNLAEFEKKFRDSMKSPVALLNIITGYILRHKGKQMRPMFVFLSAGICGTINESTYRAASLIELLHTATLVHDDVVDESNYRRGFLSINALWRNKIAVLVGDYLLSKGMLLALENDEVELLKLVSNATREMSEGELLQIEKARRLDVTEEVYFEIIRKKTASLIAACCATGAASTHTNPVFIQKMHDFGENVGMAFQIKDDLFDYEADHLAGKPNGLDIKEKKLTLPLIRMLGDSDWKKKKKFIHIIKRRDQDPEKIAGLIGEVHSSDGIPYARKKMAEYQDNAFRVLHEFPDSPFRQAMEKLVRFTTERNR